MSTRRSHGDESDPDRTRLLDSVETALKLGEGIINVATVPSDPDTKPEETTFSEHLACPNCGFSTGEIEPRNFSFNAPQGACPACSGLGLVQEFDPELVIPNTDLTLAEGAVQPWVRASQSASGYYAAILDALSKRYKFSTKVPVRELPESALQADPLRQRRRADQGRLRGLERAQARPRDALRGGHPEPASGVSARPVPTSSATSWGAT